MLLGIISRVCIARASGKADFGPLRLLFSGYA